jgi:dipeptidyl aminopeptidase/acylaminoacyl peptidase
VEPSDIGRIVGASNPTLSPDGGTVAFVVTRVDLDANRYRSAVWLAATDGSTPPYRFSAGEHGDAAPAWSPDGRFLAFTSRRAASTEGKGDERRASLHVVPVGIGGEVATVAEGDEGFGRPAWSPDGRHIAYTTRVRGPRWSAGDDDDARPPRRVDRLLTRIDDEGWIVDRPQHVFVVPADGTAAPRQVTEGDFEHGSPVWSPDGNEIAFVAARQDDWDLSEANDVWVVAAAGGAPRRVTDTSAVHLDIAWGPGGRLASFVAEVDVEPSNAQVATVDVATGTVTELTRSLDRNCAPLPGTQAPVLDGDQLWFTIEDRGDVPIYRVGADDGSVPERVVAGERWVTGYDVAGGLLAFTAASPTSVPEVFVVDLDAGVASSEECMLNGARHDREPTSISPDPGGTNERLAAAQRDRLTELPGSLAGRSLTSVGAAFHAACPPVAPERFAVPSAAGGDIDAWLVRPPGWSGDGRVPVLLSVHGGPATQYGSTWFDEFQLWASAGFAVLYANPHGSSGFTEDWVRSIRSPLAAVAPGHGWGSIDADDLMAVVDAALERWPQLDGERVGVLGGSYGGYMASWLIGHSDRFAAACSERAVNNLSTLETASDAAGYFRFVFGVSHLDEPDEYMARSPITAVRDIATPVLILHSEDDLRCPVEQADQLFVALRLLGRQVEYHRFPGESHELSRSGSPKHRVQRAELIIDWFRRHLHS